MGTVGNASCTIVDPRNGSGDEDTATMMVVVDDDGDGGGKYGTPGAGVIIYLAPEIGPADTAGRFNGRTMLELTKTKTKHQLGDFFFHFFFASFTSASFFLSLSFSLSLFIRFARLFLKPRRKCVRHICVVHLCHPWSAFSRTKTANLQNFNTPPFTIPPPPFPFAVSLSQRNRAL